MHLRDLVLNGYLDRESLTTGDVQKYKEAIGECLADANNDTNANRTRLLLAYDAILKCALLALRVDGYRLKATQGHHQIALETLAETVGSTDADIDYFSELSRIRHADVYDSQVVSDSDVKEAIEAANQLEKKTAGWVDFRLKNY